MVKKVKSVREEFERKGDHNVESNGHSDEGESDVNDSEDESEDDDEGEGYSHYERSDDEEFNKAEEEEMFRQAEAYATTTIPEGDE